MATVNREAIETFMSVTGASETIAIQRLEEYGGNLNEAINAHFSEGDRNNAAGVPVPVAAPPSDFMDIDDPPQMVSHPSSLLSATRGMNPFSLLDPTFSGGLFEGRSLFDTPSHQEGRTPFVSHPRQVREVPIEVKDSHDFSSGHSGHGPRIEDVTDAEHTEVPEIRGTVVIDDDDDDDDDTRGNRNSETNSRPSAPVFDEMPYDGHDIEEEMIRAAIEASKREAELQDNPDLHNVKPMERPSQHNDAELADVVSLSLKTAEDERLQREQTLKAGASGSRGGKTVEMEDLGMNDESNLRPGFGSLNKASSSQRTNKSGNLSIQDKFEELDEQPLVRNRSRHVSSDSEEVQREVGEAEVNPALGHSQPTSASQTHVNGNAFPSDEWGGISSEEHDEAVMLEAAMFGGIPESGYQFPYASNRVMHPGLDSAWRAPRSPSPGLVAQRAIREQQDDEYFASLQADREKELKALEEEKAAWEAALEDERRKEEESRKKLEEEQEFERQLAAKEASLPKEPAVDDENAVNLLVRMPDGSRRGRRFLKSDKLQSLFDFIAVGRGVKPGTYRLVRPYPRKAFSDEEGGLTLNELGLTSKQEALFLELI